MNRVEVPAEAIKARELVGDPDSYDEEGRMRPEVRAKFQELADRIGGPTAPSRIPLDLEELAAVRDPSGAP